MSGFQKRHRNCVDCLFFNEDACDLGVPRDLIDDPNLFVCARNEIRPPDAVAHKTIPGFVTRSWFDDPSMVSEAVRTGRDLPVTADDVVLDIGAHIGSFGFMTLVNGVKKCVFVEADPMNWPVLHANAAHFGSRAEVMDCAIVGDENRPDNITLWRTGYSGCSSVMWRKRTFFTKTPTAGFIETLDRIRPTILKLDVEGAEHFYDWDHLNPELRLLYLELHTAETGGFLTAGRAIEERIKTQGFTTIKSKERHAFLVLVMER